MAQPLRPVPIDFREVAPGKPLRWLATHYRTRIQAVCRWFDEAGIPRPNTRPANRKECPPDFHLYAPHETNPELMVRFNLSQDLVARFRRQTGCVAPHFAKGASRRSPIRFKRAAEKRLAVVMDNRDDSEASRAQSYLQRFYPVWRCKEDGTFDPKGSHFRCDGITRTQEEMIERAVRKGWQRDDWRRIAA